MTTPAQELARLRAIESENQQSVFPDKTRSDMMRLIEWQAGALKQAREQLDELANDNLLVFQNYIADKYEHDGDCTKRPYACIRCALSTTIKETKETLALTDPESGEL